MEGSTALLLDATHYFNNADLSDVTIVIREASDSEPTQLDEQAHNTTEQIEDQDSRCLRLPGHKIILSAYSALFRTKVGSGRRVTAAAAAATACHQLHAPEPTDVTTGILLMYSQQHWQCALSMGCTVQMRRVYPTMPHNCRAFRLPAGQRTMSWSWWFPVAS